MMVVQLFFVIKKGETLFLQFNLDTFELYFCKLIYFFIVKIYIYIIKYLINIIKYIVLMNIYSYIKLLKEI